MSDQNEVQKTYRLGDYKSLIQDEVLGDVIENIAKLFQSGFGTQAYMKVCNEFNDEIENNENFDKFLDFIDDETNKIHFGFVEGMPSTHKDFGNSNYNLAIGLIPSIIRNNANIYKTQIFCQKVCGKKVKDTKVKSYNLEALTDDKIDEKANALSKVKS